MISIKVALYLLFLTMPRFQHTFIFVILWGLLLGSCTKLDDPIETPIAKSDYALLYQYENINMYYVKLYVLDYFKSIALGAEYGNASRVTRKWKKPMRLYAMGELNDTLHYEINRIIEEINFLTGEDFYIEQVKDSVSANFCVYLGDAISYTERFPSAASFIGEKEGLVQIHYSPKNEILRGEVFVDARRTTLERQFHLLREEITQGLGLMNDIPYVRQSIFYEGYSDTVEYAPNDREVIRLLYHPVMREGLTETGVDVAGRKILGL